MITEVQIKNYRSIVEATVKLSPFTLLIGANGSGKSTFLRLFKDLLSPPLALTTHINQQDEAQEVVISHKKGDPWTIKSKKEGYDEDGEPLKSEDARIFSINPARIGEREGLVDKPVVKEDGTGAVQVLDALKSGDKEDLFNKIESALKSYIPEIEKLSFLPSQWAKQLQVREKHINKPILVAELSEGTRLILTLLTIIHQEEPPTVIGIEDIDRGLPPQLFEQVIKLLLQTTANKEIQIIATTHNPDAVDKFAVPKDAVIFVEKAEGKTQFTPLNDFLAGTNPLDTL